MAWVRQNISQRSAAVGDAYRTVADLLLGITAKESGYRIPNGILAVITQGATLQYGKQPADLAAGVGQPIAAGAGIGLQSDLDAAWDLAEVWVRNTTPTVVATIVVNGPVFVWRN